MKKLKIICGTITGIIVIFIYVNLNKKRLEPCDFSQQKVESLRILIKTVASALEMYNVTYWVDYGTALGAYRYCDVIPWDHDADMGYLDTERNKVVQAAAEVNRHKGFSMDDTKATYRNQSLDLFPWKKVKNWWTYSSVRNLFACQEDTSENYKLYVLRPDSNPLKIYILNFFIEYLPFAFLNERSRVKIADFEVYTVRSIRELVKWRYFLTYDKVVPFYLYCLKSFFNSSGGMNKCVKH